MTKFIIYLFDYDAAQSVTTRRFDGEHWYMASDICGLIGIAGYSSAVLRHLDHDEYRKETMYIGGYGKKHVLLINNSGVIRLIKSVRSENARHLQGKLKKLQAKHLPDHQHYLLQMAA